jgi:hypothetical protein
VCLWEFIEVKLIQIIKLSNSATQQLQLNTTKMSVKNVYYSLTLVLLGLVFTIFSKTQNVLVMYISEDPQYTNNKHENVKLKYKKEKLDLFNNGRETIVIYQTNSQYRDKSFQEIKDSYGLKWAQVGYDHTKQYGHRCGFGVLFNSGYECGNGRCSNRVTYNSIQIYKTLDNNAPEISNLDECFDLMYESDFFMNVKKYTEGTHTKWRDVSYVLTYLSEYVNN